MNANNPFAFPVPKDAHDNGQEGMTLRDVVAIAALQSLILSKPYYNPDISERVGNAEMVKDALDIADTFIEQCNEK